MATRTLWLGLTLGGMLAGCQAEGGPSEGTDSAWTPGGSSGATSPTVSAGSTSGPSMTSGPAMTATEPEDSSSEGSGSGDSGSSSTGESPEAFHTCGNGGAKGAWTVFEVPYPAGTTLANGTEVTTARYEVWAPDVSGPLPLVVALHGDEGNPGPVKSHWAHLMDTGNFILVTPREPHQEADGSGSDNGWDNHSEQTRQFLHAMFDDVGTRYDIDIDRVYATGASAGSWVGGQIFFTMQDIWAAVQFNCGGATGVGYTEPTDAVCVTPARFETAPSDFLYDAAVATAAFVEERGHEVEFHDTACRGHCCGQREDYGDAAWDFFEPRVHCGALSRAGCGEIPTP